MFDLHDAKGVLMELNACRKVYGDRYIRLSAFDSSHGWESVRISFIVNRPKNEDGLPSRSHGSSRPRAALYDARLCDRPARREALRMNAIGECRPAAPAKINLADEFARVGRRARAQAARRRADRPRAGQAAHPRDRGAPAGRSGALEIRPRLAGADPAHELHRQSRHRQDDGRDAHGRDPAPARLRPPRPSGRGDARRSRRPVHRPHRAQDQGGAQEGDGRRAVHRRGLLPLSPGERARLRPGVDRDSAAGDGEQARRSRRDPRRLRRPDGPLLPLQSGLPLARRPSHRLSRLHRRRALRDRREDARLAQLQAEPGGAARRSPSIFRCGATQPLFANARSIRNALDRARLRQANRLFAARRLRN